MKPVAVHHVQIQVDDLDAALRFYTEVLGLTPNPDRPDFGFPGAWLDAGAQQVHLVVGPLPTQVGQHFALAVEDLDDAVAELRAGGLKVSDVMEFGPFRQAMTHDPAGNTIEIRQA
ncbi:MAG TPA: VOC family protein [Acidimicrobiales bacterium]|nr:VOC family protein [Acidimicrobiales bacterium]